MVALQDRRLWAKGQGAYDIFGLNNNIIFIIKLTILIII